LGYHTTAQIFAGGSLGLLLGAGWFFFMDTVVAPWFPWIEDTSICQYLRIKDSSHIPDVIGFEYMNSREARMSSQKASSTRTSSEKVSQDWGATTVVFTGTSNSKTSGLQILMQCAFILEPMVAPRHESHQVVFSPPVNTRGNWGPRVP